MERTHLNRLYEPSMTKVVYLTEVYGQKPEIEIRCPDDLGGPDFTITASYGDIIAICNALEDYANALDGVITDWDLQMFKAATFELHAARLRGISRRFGKAIGYDYLKAMARCEKSKHKKNRDNDTGKDAFSLLIKKTERESD